MVCAWLAPAQVDRGEPRILPFSQIPASPPDRVLECGSTMPHTRPSGDELKLGDKLSNCGMLVSAGYG